MNESVLIISDLHTPFEHQDSFAFLKAIKEKYKPTNIICMGDELDNHSISYHEKDPNLMSPIDELELSKKKLKVLFEMFPKMDLLDSNHGSLIARKIKSSGLAYQVIRSMNDILGAPIGWKWHSDLTIETPLGKVFLHHGMNSNASRLSKSLGMSVICAHYHSQFSIEYFSTPNGLFYSMQAGSLIDTKSLAFSYNKLDVKRPLIGCGIILNGLPKLLPMVLTRGCRWNKVIP